MSSDYHIGICRPLYRLSYFNVCLLITTLFYVGHCIVCPTSMYVFWLPHWYLLAIVLSVLLQCMSSDYHFVICWPLYCLSYFNICLLITTLYLLAIVLSVLLQCMSSDYPFVICRPLYCLSYFNVCLLITTLVSVGHCIVCPTSMYVFWLPLCYMLAIVLSVLLQCMSSDYHIGICWPLYCLSYFNVCLLITPLLYVGHCIVCPTSMYVFWLPHWYILAIVLSVLLQCMSSDYPFVICRPLYCLSYFNVCLLITPLLFVGHCIVCPTSMYVFWLPLCYMLAIVLSVLFQCMSSDYPFVICWPLYRLSYFNVCLLITPLLYVGHCIVCPTSMYVFWLPHWYMLAIVISVLLQCMSSDYPFVICRPFLLSVLLQCMSSDYLFVICRPLYCLSYFNVCLLITTLVSVGHCIVCPTSMYAFWLPHWYL